MDLSLKIKKLCLYSDVRVTSIAKIVSTINTLAIVLTRESRAFLLYFFYSYTPTVLIMYI